MDAVEHKRIVIEGIPMTHVAHSVLYAGYSITMIGLHIATPPGHRTLMQQVMFKGTSSP